LTKALLSDASGVAVAEQAFDCNKARPVSLGIEVILQIMPNVLRVLYIGGYIAIAKYLARDNFISLL
jgi:hypothetical protein